VPGLVPALLSHSLDLVAGAVTITLAPDHGGRIAQIRLGDRELLRGVEHATGWADWGSYPMVPWTNRIPGGVRVEVPVNSPDGSALHGLAADSPWEVLDVDASAASLELEASVGCYDIVARQHFVVHPDRLEQRLAVVNRAGHTVPAGVGIHPWFAAAPVRVPADEAWPAAGPLDPMPVGPARPVTPDEDLRTGRVAPPMDRCYTALTDSQASIGDLVLSWSGPVTQVVVYTGYEGWVCVEPATMANDGFRLCAAGVRGTGVRMLAPGERLEIACTLSWPVSPPEA